MTPQAPLGRGEERGRKHAHASLGHGGEDQRFLSSGLRLLLARLYWASTSLGKERERKGRLD